MDLDKQHFDDPLESNVDAMLDDNQNENSMFYRLDEASLPMENKFSFIRGSLISSDE